MALLTLLLALIIERTAELSNRWQLQYWIDALYVKAASYRQLADYCCRVTRVTRLPKFVIS